MASVLLRDVKKVFAKTTAVGGVTLSIEAGEFFVLLGPSGCGKTTLLRVIAGLERATSGEVKIGETIVDAGGVFVDPAARGLGFVFQDLALWPHMTALDHLTFVLGTTGTREERRTRARRALGDMQIGALEKRKPHELSGGERQRLALARALVANPGIVLFDEPLSSVDPSVAKDVRRLLKDVNRERGVTMIYVTHLQDEAFELARRIAVMRSGRIEQVGAPESVYARPDTAFVASFVGECALVEGRIAADGRSLDTPLGTVAVAAGRPVARRPAVCVRGHELSVVGTADGVPAVVVETRFRGGSWTNFVKLGDLRLPVTERSPRPIGETVGLRFGVEPWTVDLSETSS